MALGQAGSSFYIWSSLKKRNLVSLIKEKKIEVGKYVWQTIATLQKKNG
jgi:hypothetical protein